MKVLVCGSRHWDDKIIVRAVLDGLLRTVPHHSMFLIEGGARGADNMAADWASDRSVTAARYPADWEEHGRAAGPIRNQEMLNALLGGGKRTRRVVVAFTDDLDSSTGTRNMVYRARKHEDVTVYVIGRKS